MSATFRSVRLTRALATAGVGLFLACGGCQFSKRTQLENVAKDWCYTIRASQVIPVYPLTADVQAGDIFLVTVPTDQQQRLYKERGFLAMDNHLGRIDPDGYSAFYGSSYFDKGKSSTLPRDWIRPRKSSSRTIASWDPAPTAAFPQYSFTVNRGGGLSLGVPISGVPVGLSLMGSDAANGTITIDEARTMGVDIMSLYRELQVWAASNADFLAYFGPDKKRKNEYNYLRVVYRVYATGKMDVFLADQSSGAVGLDVGVPKPVELLSAKTATTTGEVKGNTIQDYQTNLATLNEIVGKIGTPQEAGGARSGAAAAAEAAVGAAADQIAKVLPGGSLRVNAAAGRAISLSQTFDPPLVLGYLSFDVAIGPSGRLGRPIPTLAVVDSDFASGLSGTEVINTLYGAGVPTEVYRFIDKDRRKDPEAAAALDGLDAVARQFVPRTMVDYGQAARPASGEEDLVIESVITFPAADEITYLDWREYRGALGGAARRLESELGKPQFRLKRQDGTIVTVQSGDAVHTELKARAARYNADADNQAMMDAVRAASGRAASYYIGVLGRD